MYLSRPSLPELDDQCVEVFFSLWISAATPLAPKSAHDVAERDAGRNYNSATRTVYIGTDPTLHRLPGTDTGAPPVAVPPRFYWRRAAGFNDGAVAPDPTAHADPSNSGSDTDLLPSDDELALGAAQADAALPSAPQEDPPLVRLGRVPLSKQSSFALRELARNRGARSYGGFLTDAAGVVHDSPMAASRAMGYLDESTEAITVLRREIRDGLATPIMLRSLFVQMIVAKEAMDGAIDEPGVLDALREPGWTSEDVVYDLGTRLRAMGRDVTQSLPPHHHPWVVANDLQRELDALPSPAVWDQRVSTSSQLQLDAHQQDVVRWMLTGRRAVPGAAAGHTVNLADAQYVRPFGCGVATLLGGAGAGKSRVFHRIIAEFGRRGMFVKVAATSNLAATAFPRAGTVHSLFDLKIGADDDGNFRIAFEPEGTVHTDVSCTNELEDATGQSATAAPPCRSRVQSTEPRGPSHPDRCHASFGGPRLAHPLIPRRSRVRRTSARRLH